MTKKWYGKVGDCDLCGDPLELFPWFADAKSPRGPWGLFCPYCCSEMDITFGTGRGQKYDSITKEKMEG